MTNEMVGASQTLMTIKDLADRLTCSTRTLRRLHDSGRMPAAIRLGNLLRWDRAVIERWIAGGCPDCREDGR